MLYGNMPLLREWRKHLVVAAVLCTDAKSLHDHLNKTGGIPKERQVLLDLLAVRNAVEEQELAVRWLPSKRNLADILTKAMESEAFTRLMKDSRWCLLPTEDEQQHEDHLVALRRAQRERRKAKMKGNP